MSQNVRVAMFLSVLVCGRTEARANPPRFEPLFQLAWRHESFDTLSNDPLLDERYGFGHLRLRSGMDLAWRRWTFHGLAQGAAAYSLPAKAAFGIGRSYFEASGGDDRSPAHLRLAELSAFFQATPAIAIGGGRLGLTDGLETLTGDARFDAIKRTRLSERLVGTWDWVNVGRRFDGAAASLDRERWHLSGYAARILQGGADYENAFERLDGVDVFGSFFTAKRGAWIGQTEVRLFNVLYRDDRPSTRAVLGERLLVDAIGASVVGLYPRATRAFDVMLWSAFELGEYGSQEQRAWAWVAEAGHAWREGRWTPWLRAGCAQSSGDGEPGDGTHATFFNMAPTNHKYYGFQDLNAFQNLTNLYAQLQVRPHRWVGLLLDVHRFWRTEAKDAWYGGSGPANHRTFGYEARRAPASAASVRSIGTEIDMTVSVEPRPELGFQFGFSRFFGSRFAEAVFPVHGDFTWAYVQVTLRH